MTDRLMYDAVDVAAIPRDATMVAGYIDGGYVTWPALVHRFPHARKVSITVLGNVNADVLDVESGDATNEQAVRWADHRYTAALPAIVYTSASNVGPLLAQFDALRVARPHLWVADWTGVPHLYSGSVATQYASPTTPPPGQHISYDVSLVAPTFPSETHTTGGTMTFKLPGWGPLYRMLALVGSGLAYVVAIGNQLHLPNSVRVALVGAASGIAWIEHHKVTAATPPKPPAGPTGG